MPPLPHLYCPCHEQVEAHKARAELQVADKISQAEAEAKRQAKATRELKVELAHQAEARAAAEEKIGREREANARWQEHVERELAQCRDRLVVRAEQLLRLDPAGETRAEAAAVGGAEESAKAAAMKSDGAAPQECEEGATEGAKVVTLAAAADIVRSLREERESHRCAVCLRAPRQVVLMPCRHAVLCASCTQHIERSSCRCPLCRTPIESSVRIFQ